MDLSLNLLYIFNSEGSGLEQGNGKWVFGWDAVHGALLCVCVLGSLKDRDELCSCLVQSEMAAYISSLSAVVVVVVFNEAQRRFKKKLQSQWQQMLGNAELVPA